MCRIQNQWSNKANLIKKDSSRLNFGLIYYFKTFIMKKIQTIKPFFLIPIYLLFILFSFNVGIAQTISRTLEIKESLGLLKNSDFGIISESDKIIHVFVYDQYLYDKTAGTISEKQYASFMYGFKSNGNTNGAYQNISFGINDRFSWRCYFGLCPFKYEVNSGTISDNSNSLRLFKKAVRARQHYTIKQIPNSGAQFFTLSDGTINVLIKVVLSSGANLSDIKSIKIPGISEISGSAAFIPKVFAFFGNYGCANKQGAEDVANFVKTTIQPDIIVSAGNDSYHRLPSNECGTSFNDNNGALYNLWANTNRFISVLGNKDYEDGNGHHLDSNTGQQQWKNYFNRTELNNSYTYGDIEFFMINTNIRYELGTDPADNFDLAATKTWLTEKLAASNQHYKIVVGHHAAHNSGQNESVLKNWNFRDMGADMYISSGSNYYERHDVNGIPHVNVGLGGFSKDQKNWDPPQTLVKDTHYAANFGALTATVGANNLRFEFKTTNGEKVDEFYLFGLEKQNPGNNYYLEKLRGTPIASSSKSLDVYLILGQSNASGRCGGLCFRDFNGEYSGELTNSYLLNEKNEFEHARNSFARYSTVEKYVFNSGLGVGWSFAKELNSQQNSRELGFISNARGGVTTEQWFPDYVLPEGENYGETSIGYTPGNNLYQEAKARYDAVKIKYPNANLKGVIWMQGESDVININTNNYDYIKRTKELIQHFRNDYGIPELQFLFTELAYRPGLDHMNEWSHAQLNKQMHTLADNDLYIILATVEGLETFDTTNVHWDQESYNTLGVRLATLEIQQNMNRSANTSNKTKQAVIVSTSIYKDLLIYPNPTKEGSFNLEFGLEKEGPVSIEIFNITGKKIYNKQVLSFNKGNHKIEFGKSDINLASGVYLLEVVTNELTQTRKLIVE